MLIREETAADIAIIGRVITDAMKLLAQATGTEARIVEKLRVDGALALSLVAEENGEVIGHLAVSAAQIGMQSGWALIGPLAVVPARHRQGIGSALMNEALRRLRKTSRGAALVGSPTYYGRFGFRAFPGFGVTGIPSQFVQALPFDDTPPPQGELIHHPAFGVHQSA